MTDTKHYRCIKQVHAKPMTRGEYNKYRGWDIPADENPADDGYLVIYNKNTDDHYESWSPKRVFDDGYLEIPAVSELSTQDLMNEARSHWPNDRLIAELAVRVESLLYRGVM